MGVYLNGKMVSTAMPLSTGDTSSPAIDSKIAAHNSDTNAHSILFSALNIRIQNLENGGGCSVTSVNSKKGDVQLTAEDVGAVSTAMLDAAITNALAQAKESGDFKGDKGDKGENGETGPQGPTGATGTRGSTWSISDSGVPSMDGSELKGDMLLDKSNGDVYTANVETMDWEKIMNIKGPKGDSSPGSTITVDSALSSTSTNPVQNKVINTALNEKLSTSGGTLTGNLTGKYLTGTWLQTTAVTEASSVSKIAVIDNSGWIYSRSLANLKTDLGVPTKTSQLTNDAGFLTSHQSLSGYATQTWVTNQIQSAVDATWEASY